jgi:hypothetical protein
MWPSHEVFDAWIATPYRDALTSSEVHQAVSYRPITRYEVTGGYLNLPGLTTNDPAPQPEPVPPAAGPDLGMSPAIGYSELRAATVRQVAAPGPRW